MSKSLFSLLLVLLLFFLATSLARPIPRKAMRAGSWTPIDNVSDPTVQNMGSYAVQEYDKTGKPHLQFIKVVNGSTLYVSFYPSAQRIWFLNVEARNCSQHGQLDTYQAQVYENFEPGRKYLSFGFLGKLPYVNV